MARPRLPLALCLALPLAALDASAQCQVQELKGRNTVPKDFFGKSCALDGGRLVVGAFASTTGRPGSAHVFERGADGWTQVARLAPSDGMAGDEFGNSVGISGDFALVGSEYRDGAVGSNAGAAYVFQRNLRGKWLEVQRIEPTDASRSSNFGECVALEGTVAVVGSRFDEALGNNSGAAYVFERNALGKWVQTAKLIGSAGKRNDLSADMLAIDGGRIVMGSYRSDSSGGHSGSAYVFEKINGAWAEVAHLVASDGAGELSRGIAIDGDRIVLGARLESTMGAQAGAAYVFERWNGEWIQTAKLLPAAARDYDWVGESVAVEGDRIVLSGHHHATPAVNAGTAFVFEKVGDEWVEGKALVSSTSSMNDEFSFALALSGGELIATSPFESGNVGAAYVFTFDETRCLCDGSGGGTVAPFGEGAGGTNLGLLEAVDSVPNPETTMTLRVSNIPNGTTGTLFMAPQSIQRSAFGGTMLVPTTLAPIKIPFRLAGGVATLSWRVPLGLCGTTLYAQAAAADPTQPLGRTLTNGLELAIGR